MRILLINPPGSATLVANNPSFLDAERGCNPPLGLLYLAAALRAARRDDVRVFDGPAEPRGYQELRSRLEAIRPELVGVTCLTLSALDVLKTVALCKAIVPQTVVVVGGPHAYLFPEETSQWPGVDIVLKGEGEHTLPQLVERLGTGRETEVAGVVMGGEDGIRRGPEPALISNLDDLPFPARDLLPRHRYGSLLSPFRSVTTMVTSRGCPHRCLFCARPHLGKQHRCLRPERVVEEMRLCETMGFREILMYDDDFTLDRDRVFAICEEIRRRGTRVRWDIRARVDEVDSALLSALAKAGCQRIHMGVEAGTERVLKIWKRRYVLEQAEQAFSLAKEQGMETLAYFMIGAPTETREEMAATIQFAERLSPDFVHFTIAIPFPGTALYAEGLQAGRWEDVWRQFAIMPSEGFRPPVASDICTADELREILMSAYRAFYLRASYVARRLRRVRTATAFFRQSKAAAVLLATSLSTGRERRK